MSRIQIIDEKKYPLTMHQEDGLPYYRWEHRATLAMMGRRYMVFVDNGVRGNGIMMIPPCAYIEEIGASDLKKIEDGSLFLALQNFAEEKGFLEIQFPINKR
jgi:hypothetical protein